MEINQADLSATVDLDSYVKYSFFEVYTFQKITPGEGALFERINNIMNDVFKLCNYYFS